MKTKHATYIFLCSGGGGGSYGNYNSSTNKTETPKQKDYKDMSAVLVSKDGTIVKEYDDIVASVKGYIHRIAKPNVELILVVCFKLKRRQSVDSYIKQIQKAYSARMFEFHASARKLGKLFDEEKFLENLGNVSEVKVTDIVTSGEYDSSYTCLLVMDSDSVIFKE